MNSYLFNSRVTSALLLALFLSGVVQAAEKEISAPTMASAPKEPSKWRISSGVMIRSIHAKFAIDPRASDFGFSTGGSRRLFGEDLSEQQYADGSVFLGDIPAAIARQQGIAAFSGGKASNLTPLSGGPLVLPGSQLGTVAFHSNELSRGELQVNGDANLAAAPYLKADYVLYQGKSGELSLFGQYAYVADSNHSSGNVQGGLRGKSYEFRYDGAFVLAPGLVPSNVFYNADTANAFNPAFNPKPANPSVSVKPIAVNSRASISVGLHEFTLAMGYNRRLWERVHLNLAVGPTFNLFDYDFRSQSDLRVGGAKVASSRQEQSSQALRMGIMEQAGISIDLDKDGRWFLEIFGRHNWVDSFRAGNRRSNVKVDASSFSGGIGLGVRL